MTLQFEIYESEFFILFSAYVVFFAIVFGISRSISLINEKIQ